MRSMVKKFLVGIAINVAGLCAANNSLGTWTRNIEQSISSVVIGPRSIKALSLRIEASDDTVRATVKGELMNGEVINSAWAGKYNGGEYPITGAPWDMVSIKQIDANTFISETKKTGGTFHSTIRALISKDGQTMSLTYKGIDVEGKPFYGTAVYNKQ